MSQRQNTRRGRFLNFAQTNCQVSSPCCVFCRQRVHRTAIAVQDGTFFWDDSQGHTALDSVQLEIPKGSLTMVVGETGCGKSALMAALIGELHPGHAAQQQARLGVWGSIAYCSQVAWIMNATVRDNILFGSEYDSDWYSLVIDACALAADLESLPAGDQTEIGAKGINLSGGQKQRIALARAVYQRTDIVLLDDTLSAVDVHVGNHIFNKCIRRIIKDRTVVFATHSIQFLQHADNIVVLEHGRLTAQGTYKELSQKGLNFHKFAESAAAAERESSTDSAGRGNNSSTGAGIGGRSRGNSSAGAPVVSVESPEKASRTKSKKKKKKASEEVKDQEDHDDVKDTEEADEVNGQGAAGLLAHLDDMHDDDDEEHSVSRSSTTVSAVGDVKIDDDDDDSKVSSPNSLTALRIDSTGNGKVNGSDKSKDGKGGKDKDGSLTTEEGRAVGAVEWKVYKAYMEACGGWRVAIGCLISFVLRAACNIASNVWLALWAAESHHDSGEAGQAAPDNENVDNGFYLGIFSVFNFGELV